MDCLCLPLLSRVKIEKGIFVIAPVKSLSTSQQISVERISTKTITRYLLIAYPIEKESKDQLLQYSSIDGTGIFIPSHFVSGIGDSSDAILVPHRR